MKQYAVIHAVAGLFEGYSDTSCDWFATKEDAQKHIDQILGDYRKDEMCVNIDHREDDTYVTLDRDPDNYKACVPSDMDHDDYVAENMDDVSVEVFRIIEVDAWRYDNKVNTESMWLTWNQIEADQAWDYFPLCMSLVARVSSDMQDAGGDAYHIQEQFHDFISSVYNRKHAFIDVDDYVMHAFRIPKP
tara:strand:- start:231 stop:797 length:567 start_codon:yes stop_codon:yes gene_type:complete